MSAERDRDSLRAELAELDRLLAGCDPDEELTRLSFEARRAQVETELRSLETRSGRNARASLIFRGAPVLGMRGIEADFSGQALELFQRLVGKAAAARDGQALGTRGPIRNEQNSRLFLTGTIAGSFGFTLEEADGPPLLAATPLAETLDETGHLLLAAQDDEQFADAAADTDPEVIGALAKFLKLVADRGATLRVQAGEIDVAMDSQEVLRAAVARTESVREEETVHVNGDLQGLMLNGRRFELKMADSSQVISGSLSKAIANPDELKPLVFKRCAAHIRVIVFRRPGKEHRRYELLSATPPT